MNAIFGTLWDGGKRFYANVKHLCLLTSMDLTAKFYSQPSYVGAGFPVFSGSRRQRGGGIFGSLAKMVLPVLKNVGSSVLRTAGRQAVGLARDVAESALSGEGLTGVRQTLQRQGLKRLGNVGRSALRSDMSGVSAAAAPDGFQQGRQVSAAKKSSLGKRRRVNKLRTSSQRGSKRQRLGGGSTAANF